MNFVAFPSASPDQAHHVASLWKDLGWKVAVMLDAGQPKIDADIVVHCERFPGYATAMNEMIPLCESAGAERVLCANDDMYPEQNMDVDYATRSFEIAFESHPGVLQPSGDDYGGMSWSAICPLVSVDYARRINQGRGLYWPEYFSLYSDTELHDVAKMLGLYKTDSTMKVFHRHWTRGYADLLAPEKRALQQFKAAADRETYTRRRNAGFPGHELLSEVMHGN